MIFLSAQPDSNYFIWQLEIQLKNFSEFNIGRNHIHVLVSFDESNGINANFLTFSKENGNLARFFFYPDKRDSKEYIPSIRPHIIKQHFLKHTWLEKEIIFYHDSDIVFTNRLPDFERMCEGHIWYFSDTKSYLSVDHINSKGIGLLRNMCKIMNLSSSLVKKNDQNVGGAQAIIKNVNAEFWSKIEIDCVNIYHYLKKSAPKFKKQFLKNNPDSSKVYTPISAWCADMWAMLWNAYEIATVKIDHELDFCWPQDEIHLWSSMSIFHNAGVSYHEADKMFFKGDYMRISPYDKNFDFVPRTLCCYKYVEKLYNYGDSLKYDCSDVTIIIPMRIDSEDRLENLEATLKYLIKRVQCEIIVLEGDTYRKIPESIIPDNVKYIFEKDEQAVFFREKYNNKLSKLAETSIIIKYDCDVVVPYAQLYKAVCSVRARESDICYPYNGEFLRVQGAIRKDFILNQNIKTLDKYIKRQAYYTESFGGCAVIDKNSYENMGMENTNFYGWGFEDQEINKRALILKMNVKRIDGPLYHLEHQRGLNSNFASSLESLNSYREYVKVCNYSTEKLIEYIRSW